MGAVGLFSWAFTFTTRENPTVNRRRSPAICQIRVSTSSLLTRASNASWRDSVIFISLTPPWFCKTAVSRSLGQGLNGSARFSCMVSGYGSRFCDQVLIDALTGQVGFGSQVPGNPTVQG